MTRTTYPCCWTHTKYSKRGGRSLCASKKPFRALPGMPISLRVKESTIRGAGKGLFVVAPTNFVARGSRGGRKLMFREGEEVVEYFGKVLSQAELDRKYPGDTLAAYTFEVYNPLGGGNPVYIDSADWRGSSVARYVNDSCGARRYTQTCKKKYNVRATQLLRERRIVFIATRNIYDGDELFIDYGRKYWKRPGTPKRAAPKRTKK